MRGRPLRPTQSLTMGSRVTLVANYGSVFSMATSYSFTVGSCYWSGSNGGGTALLTLTSSVCSPAPTAGVPYMLPLPAEALGTNPAGGLTVAFNISTTSDVVVLANQAGYTTFSSVLAFAGLKAWGGLVQHCCSQVGGSLATCSERVMDP